MERSHQSADIKQILPVTIEQSDELSKLVSTDRLGTERSPILRSSENNFEFSKVIKSHQDKNNKISNQTQHNEEQFVSVDR